MSRCGLGVLQLEGGVCATLEPPSGQRGTGGRCQQVGGPRALRPDDSHLQPLRLTSELIDPDYFTSIE
jgi:hypothetical protein